MVKLAELPTGAASLPYAFNELVELPLSLRQSAHQALSPAEQINSIFFIPAQAYLKDRFSWRYVPEQALLFTAKGVLHVQAPASTRQTVRTTYLRADELLYARLSLLLLYGRLELVGQVNHKLTQMVVEFNTVGGPYLQPALQKLLCLAWGETRFPAPSRTLTDSAFRQLNQLSMKFRNGLLYYALQPGEQLLGLVFQPSLWTPHWHFLRRQITANTLLTITDHQLIVMEERCNDPLAKYGWVFTFYSHATIAAVELSPGEKWQELRLYLRRGEVSEDHCLILEAEAALAWQKLWSSCFTR